MGALSQIEKISEKYAVSAEEFIRSGVISACPKSIFFNASNSFSLFTDVKICEKAISH